MTSAYILVTILCVGNSATGNCISHVAPIFFYGEALCEAARPIAMRESLKFAANNDLDLNLVKMLCVNVSAGEA